ncbi:MAG: NADH-quinone oxidoreductase subunit N [Candidatus Hydrogenedentes bacterium]|nr:NADH-quinone oxidoreductase subunit N [Candidatus Hydrogenedentota bacterium]
MSSFDLYTLSPLIVLCSAPVLVMLAIAVRRSHETSVAITLASLGLAFVLVRQLGAEAPRQITPLIVIDRFALFYMALIIAAAFVVAVQGYGYLKRRHVQPDEFYILLLIATAGAAAMAASTHFASFYLGLECLSVSLYVMIGYLRESPRSAEAGLKYLILAAASAAFLLFGMALVYAQLGILDFAGLAHAKATQTGSDMIVVLGFVMMLVAVGFKLSVVPFHMWTPDVYEGAPAPVTGFVATVSKASVFALLLRYFSAMDPHLYRPVYVAVALTAVLSMLAGNLLALRQDNVKRILAYSSIAHLGYVLVAYLAGGPAAIQAVSYYLVAYFVTTLGAFGVVGTLSTRGEHREMDSIDDYRGLFWTRPWLATAFTVMLLSLAGIPLTAGFIAKFSVMSAGVGADLARLVIVLALTSIIGLFYYLRIVAVMCARPAQSTAPVGAYVPEEKASRSGALVLFALTVTLVWIGVFPAPLIGILKTLTLGAH